MAWDWESRQRHFGSRLRHLTGSNANVGRTFYLQSTVHEISLKGTNLINEDSYKHVSFIRFQAPLPGRNLALIYRFMF